MMSDEYLECSLHVHIFTFFHPVGTCKMRPANDSNAVVDPRLRVYGVRGLRVTDSSIMPIIVTGGQYITCIMIDEKVSDMIKEDWHQLYHNHNVCK
ncbi:hypothetical protein PR048_029321 [Dryococelus australis]|uniref:Glucose-methanol-choline oxidoreductase C-terminal domain-containing protein n=1 Tax=Dryococelus australis TaxID=614101 RepID=A0ABQ9GD10_9NEOP|nr:hypothetical protein PR048_029321 [Dryococelus australis]